METDYIREFITLAKLENYVAAADELYVSQPSLSKHIKSIEAELGVSLFDRTTRKVRLNRFGKSFLPYAERIVEANSEARTILSMLARDVSDTVHLGVLPSFIAYGIQNHLVSFKKQYPDNPVSLIEGTNDDLLRYLMEGRCNIALLRHVGESCGPQFVTLPYVRDALVLVIPRGHPLDDGRTSVRVEELDGMELMTSTSATEARMLSELSQRTGVTFNITSRLSRADSIVAMLKKDFGAALLMRVPTTFNYGDSVAILGIEPEVTNTVSLVYLKNKAPGLAVRNFIRAVFPEGAEGGSNHA